MSGGLSVIGDLSKTDVYNLAKWKNTVSTDIIPSSCITKTPSAELAENQVDPFDYDVISPIVDKVIYNESIDNNTPETDEIIRRINQNEYKRRQTPPILRITRKAFGMGRRFPIVNHFHE